MRRILVGRLFHETNTFIEEPTRLEDFRRRKGREILQSSGDASPLGGVLERMEKLGWEPLPTVDYNATPSGMVAADVFSTFWEEFESVAAPLLREGVDGMFVVLHGAMACEDLEDAEGEFLKRLRSLPGAGELPLYAVIDLHANVTPLMTDSLDGLSAYRENPHTDARESAVRGFALLERHLEQGVRPMHLFQPTQIMWPPTGTGTAVDPMASLEALARKLETDEPGILALNVVAGFSHADIRETGVSFTGVIDPAHAGAGREALALLAERAWELRAEGIPPEWDLEEAIEEALKVGEFPAVLVEPSDNIGGGGPGDGTSVLRALLANNQAGGVVINDPQAVRILGEYRPGDSVILSLGGKGSRLDPGPVEVEGFLERTFDGRFELEDKQSHAASMSGDFVDMGRSAVLRVGDLLILLTSHKTPPFDLGQWRHAGVDPEQLRFIGVKAAVAHRRAYDRISKQSFTVRTPGPCTSDLGSLPYQNLRRPIFPLE